MKILTKISVAAACIILSSCANNLAYTQASMAKKSDDQLFRTYRNACWLRDASPARRNIYQSSRDEILKRKLVRKSKINDIEKGLVGLGMTKSEVHMAWGKPDDTNTYMGQLYFTEQWVYGYSNFVYFNDDGIVTDLQG